MFAEWEDCPKLCEDCPTTVRSSMKSAGGVMNGSLSLLFMLNVDDGSDSFVCDSLTRSL